MLDLGRLKCSLCMYTMITTNSTGLGRFKAKLITHNILNWFQSAEKRGYIYYSFLITI